MKDIILSTDKLCKSFSNGGVQNHIIKNLDIEIYKGDFTVIMGSSGAGKSTLLYSLSGMDKPTLGTIIFCGEDISKFSNDKLAVFRRKHCGFVFQQIYLLDSMSVMDNVMTSGLLSGNKKEIIPRAKKLFKQVNLNENLTKKFPAQLSGGEAQRAGIVRALINNPEIVFADEPTGALNSSNSKAVLDVLSETNEKNNQSIVMVTHDIKSARRGNRIVYLKDGAIFGECNLGKYQSGDKERHEKLSSFLLEMGW